MTLTVTMLMLEADKEQRERMKPSFILKVREVSLNSFEFQDKIFRTSEIPMKELVSQIVDSMISSA